MLSRTKKDFPPRVNLKVVDFSSVPALTDALAGQDAVVDATFTTDDTSKRLIDASIAAGVSRFIPSDFGFDPANSLVYELPVFARKKAALQHVKAAAAASADFSWTVIACGVFLDWNLSTKYMNIDLVDKKIALFGEGTNVVPWTTLRDVGRATAAALLAPETRNRVVYVHSILKSQRQVAELAKEALGPESWEETMVDIKRQFDDAMTEFKSGHASPQGFGTMIQYASSTPDMMTKWPRDDNVLVGLKTMSDAEVRDLIVQLAT